MTEARTRMGAEIPLVTFAMITPVVIFSWSPFRRPELRFEHPIDTTVKSP